jgi:hypothetical protein
MTPKASTVRQLGRVAFFAECSPVELKALSAYLTDVEVDEGSVLVREGDAAGASAQARSSSATHSMCGVCGNMSTGRTRASR